MLPTVSEGVLRDEKRSCIGMRERGAAVSGVEGGGVRDGKWGSQPPKDAPFPNPSARTKGSGWGIGSPPTCEVC